jgi:hypothetical protein
LNVLDLISDGATVVETTTAIGGAPKSKIIFSWLNDSAAAGEFDARPTPESPWCIDWRGSLDWFHLHYRTAVIDGKEIRRVRKSPLRAELEQRLAAKRAAPPVIPVEAPTPTPRMVAPPSVYDAPAPPPRPAYAYRRPPPLDTTNGQGPPSEGRFVVATHRYSLDERRGGKPEVTEQGIRWH